MVMEMKLKNIKWTLPRDSTIKIYESEEEYNWSHSISYENKFILKIKN